MTRRREKDRTPRRVCVTRKPLQSGSARLLSSLIFERHELMKNPSSVLAPPPPSRECKVQQAWRRTCSPLASSSVKVRCPILTSIKQAPCSCAAPR
eukprot:6173702-Pleurochrysis_carterae.AAC.3